MGVIIYGTKKNIKSDKNLGVQVCKNCGHRVEMALAHETGYFHIYYIPLVPIGGWKVKLCPVCGISEKLDGATFKALKKQ